MTLTGLVVTLRDENVRRVLNAAKDESSEGDPTTLQSTTDALEGNSAFRAINSDSERTYLKNTAEALASGKLGELLGVEDEVGAESEQASESLSDESINDCIQTFVTPIKERFPRFFDECPPQEGEFLVGWADKHLLTNERIIVFPESGAGEQARAVPLGTVVNYESTASSRPSPI